jgi:hypothetical protein
MYREDPADTVFSLPAVDDPASTEAGVILMGLDTGHLLAGLAIASLADDAGAVVLLVDEARHRGSVSLSADTLVAAGVRRWRAVRASLPAAGFADDGASPRLAWARAYQALAHWGTGGGDAGGGDTGGVGPAAAVYLTACTLRHSEVDRYCQAWPG